MQFLSCDFHDEMVVMEGIKSQYSIPLNMAFEIVKSTVIFVVSYNTTHNANCTWTCRNGKVNSSKYTFMQNEMKCVYIFIIYNSFIIIY